jgi:hypothetical protein
LKPPNADAPLPDKLHNRVVAAVAGALLEEFPDKPQIARKFVERHKRGKFGSGNNTIALIRTWSTALYAQGSVHDRPRTGRPSLISDADALALAQLLVAGYYKKVAKKKVWRGFSGLADARRNVKYGKHVRRILDKYSPDMDLESAMRRIKGVVPWLGSMKKNVDYKMLLSPENKEERREMAEWMRHLSIAELEAVIWLDAKKYYVEPGTYKVYCMDPDLVVEDGRIPKGSLKGGTVLHYYSAVNAKLGVVYFCWVTGTTGKPKVYYTRVRPAAVSVYARGCY